MNGRGWVGYFKISSFIGMGGWVFESAAQAHLQYACLKSYLGLRDLLGVISLHSTITII